MVMPGTGIRAAIDDIMSRYPLPRFFIASPKSRQVRVTVVICRFIIACTRSRSSPSSSLKKNIPALLITTSGRMPASSVHQAKSLSAASGSARSWKCGVTVTEYCSRSCAEAALSSTSRLLTSSKS